MGLSTKKYNASLGCSARIKLVREKEWKVQIVRMHDPDLKFERHIRNQTELTKAFNEKVIREEAKSKT